jgi:hypothetical protein
MDNLAIFLNVRGAVRIEVGASAALIQSSNQLSAAGDSQETGSEPQRVKHEVDGGAIVIDHKTNLVWDANTTAESKTWAEADAAAKSCRLGGFTDWRLPTLDELESIRDISRYNPAIDTSLFSAKSEWYWTASPDASDPGCAWIVGFSYGGAYLYGRYGRCCVRAVRSVARPSQ